MRHHGKHPQHAVSLRQLSLRRQLIFKLSPLWGSGITQCLPHMLQPTHHVVLCVSSLRQPRALVDLQQPPQPHCQPLMLIAPLLFITNDRTVPSHGVRMDVTTVVRCPHPVGVKARLEEPCFACARSAKIVVCYPLVVSRKTKLLLVPVLRSELCLSPRRYLLVVGARMGH